MLWTGWSTTRACWAPTGSSPAPDWRPTSERFRDPRSNRVMRVWEDAGGARHYVPDEAQR